MLKTIENLEQAREIEFNTKSIVEQGYRKQAIRLAPNNYIEAQNWLKTTGRMVSDNMY